MIDRVREAAARRLLFLPHAVQQMSRVERMISTREVYHVVTAGEVVENYPDDARGHSCLVLGIGDDERPLHVVCAPKDDYLAIITAYVPDPQLWTGGFRVRRS